jgi:hypothetical protein
MRCRQRPYSEDAIVLGDGQNPLPKQWTQFRGKIGISKSFAMNVTLLSQHLESNGRENAPFMRGNDLEFGESLFQVLLGKPGVMPQAA